jgi:hypothetical protein
MIHPDDDETLVPSPVVRKENGDISDMTLWRWSQPGSRVRFPPPDEIINGRKYWKRGTLRRHREMRASRTCAVPVPPWRQERSAKG